MKTIIILLLILLAFSACGQKNPADMTPEERQEFQDSQYWAPSRCTIIGDFSCEDYSFDENSLSLEILSSIDAEVESVSIKSTKNSRFECDDSLTNLQFTSGETKTLVFDCKNIDKIFEAEIEIIYTEDSGLKKSLMGIFSYNPN